MHIYSIYLSIVMYICIYIALLYVTILYIQLKFMMGYKPTDNWWAPPRT